MIKSGILVNKLDMSQLGYSMTVSVNELLNENNDLDVLVFYETWGKAPTQTQFCMMMERECWGLQGNLISTDIRTTERMIRCPGPRKKYFYVWNLEWVFMDGLSFEYLSSVYCHPSIELIARSQSHAKILTETWKKPAYVMENFDKTVLKAIIES